MKRMKATGFAPAVVVETSPGNFQAWLKHPRQLPREMSTLAARKLAEEFGGDKGAADWRHFGRLSGLTNRKAKYMERERALSLRPADRGPRSTVPAGERFVEAIAAQREIGRARRAATAGPALGEPRQNHAKEHGRLPIQSAVRRRCHARRPRVCNLFAGPWGRRRPGVRCAQGPRSVPQGRREAPGAICRTHDCQGSEPG